jgi:sulfotransferase
MHYDKTIYFVSGLPRSGSTLLMNILGQNPRFYVTPTSGILDMLAQVRNSWDKNDANRARDRQENETLKRNVLRSMLYGYFEKESQPVCFDKNRYWLEFLEMAGELIGGRDKLRVLVTVRDLRDVLASFESLYRKTSALGQVPLEINNLVKCKTALGRFELFIDDAQPVGRAFNAVRDALTRGWREHMHFIDYIELTNRPGETLDKVYAFLGEPRFEHDFDNVEQITTEDDFAYGFKDLHKIRTKVAPQSPQWPRVFDDSVQGSPAWQRVAHFARFWDKAVTAQGISPPQAQVAGQPRGNVHES